MSADSILKALLTKGYFPKELPPTFTTETFGQHAREIITEWQSAKLFERKQKKRNKTKFKSGSYGYELPNAEMEIISIPKLGFERRNIGITHPIPQSLLTFEIANNYKVIQKWLCRQTFSLDEIKVSSNYARAIRGINFALHRAKKSYIEATSDWLVKTDITRFYPSIYTHSITWAAYGNEKVKGKLKNFEGSLADRLDILVRACNRNQTVGIPIGPETSRIIAEIVSSRIDDDLRVPMADIKIEAIDRLQDDWFIGTKTLESSEKVLSEVVRAYREYGLDINGSKTSVTRVIKHLEDSWKSEIGAFLSHKPGELRGSRLRELLALTLRLQMQYDKQSVTNYSLTVLEAQNFSKSDVEAMESFLLKAAIIAPGSLARISELILNLDHDTGALSKKRIGPRFTELAVRALEKGDLYEAIWFLYTLRGLKIVVSDTEILRLAGLVKSSVLALILLDMNAKGLIRGALPIAAWESQISKDAVLHDPVWLLAYEGCRRGWLADKTGVMNHAFFAAMNARGVIFYDERRNVRKRKQMAKFRQSLRANFQKEVRRFLFDVREVDFDSGY